MKQLLLLFLFLSAICQAQTPSLNDHTVCFYYNWYGSNSIDGNNYHWAHPVMPQNDNDTTKKFFPGNGDIGANFYPSNGEYSSADPALIEKHMQEIESAGIGIIAVTWLGENDYTFKSVTPLLDAASRHGIKVCFQIEPIVRKTVFSTCDAVRFIIDKFGNHPAFYKSKETNRPMFFVYDSYVIPAKEWAVVLSDSGKQSIRNSKYDSDMIGLWCWKEDSLFFEQSGFDGFYTYFASRGFTFGSTPENWSSLQKWADLHKQIFIPSVGPGYNDERIRPWNTRNNKDRENGKYYDRMFEDAIASKVKWIGITSFNEWHEGTQIEPATKHIVKQYQFLDYGELNENYYLIRTNYWLQQWKESKSH
ncbi:MAG TPA: alpha-mannosidase [Bacteroidia bacterium]|nr:alpha-mannosidase [Bacteroidia bacterium]HQK96788.1 alpha-mannosidase [Bacteroidia bacterium]